MFKFLFGKKKNTENGQNQIKNSAPPVPQKEEPKPPQSKAYRSSFEEYKAKIFSINLYENESTETQEYLRELKILKSVGGKTVDLNITGGEPDYCVTVDGKFVGNIIGADSTWLTNHFDDIEFTGFSVWGGATDSDGVKRNFVFSVTIKLLADIEKPDFSKIQLAPCKKQNGACYDEVVYLSSTKKIHRGALSFGCGVGPAGCKSMLFEEALAAGGVECAKCFK